MMVRFSRRFQFFTRVMLPSILLTLLAASAASGSAMTNDGPKIGYGPAGGYKGVLQNNGRGPPFEVTVP